MHSILEEEGEYYLDPNINQPRIAKMRRTKQRRKEKRRTAREREMDLDINITNNTQEETDTNIMKVRKDAVLAVSRVPDAGVRTRAMVKGHNRIDSWNKLRLRLVSAKMKNAFSHEFLEVRKRKYTVIRKLGDGGFGKVYLVHDENRILRAAKVVNMVGVGGVTDEDSFREVQLLRKLSQVPQIVRLVDYEKRSTDDGVMLYMILEKGDSSLENVIKKYRNQMSPSCLVCFWESMLEAVNAMHRVGIIHLDLKPANFLYVKGYLKLIDLGTSEVLKDGIDYVYLDVVTGSPGFMGPEYSLRSSLYTPQDKQYKLSKKADVFALGVCLEILLGNVAADCHKNNQLVKLLVGWQAKCVQDQPHTRPTIKQLIEIIS